MSSKRNKTDLNISGLSPLVLNILSPKSSHNSPAKDFAILESIEQGKEAVILGYEKYKAAESNGLTCINIIHNFKEKSRTSSESQQIGDLESYCKKLKAIELTFHSTINQVITLRDQMRSSINILATMGDNDAELKNHLVLIERFLNKLNLLYVSDLKIKKTVIENIAHTSSSAESHVLIASWTCNPESNEIFKLIMQLKVSPVNFRWYI